MLYLPAPAINQERVGRTSIAHCKDPPVRPFYVIISMPQVQQFLDLRCPINEHSFKA